MNKEFQWTDELVKEWTSLLGQSAATRFQSEEFNKMFNQFKESKQPKPLFKTANGVYVFIGDWYWSVSDDFGISVSLNVTMPPEYSTDRTFSTREAAEEYVWKNKPMFSYQDVMNRLHAYFKDHELAHENLSSLAKQKIIQK